MLKCTAVGNLGNDCTVKHHEGRTVINFSLAHNNKYKDKQGVVHERTIWLNCSVWRNSDSYKNLAQYLTKGKTIYVEGEPAARAYVDQDHQPVAVLDLNVTDLSFV